MSSVAPPSGPSSGDEPDRTGATGTPAAAEASPAVPAGSRSAVAAQPASEAPTAALPATAPPPGPSTGGGRLRAALGSERAGAWFVTLSVAALVAWTCIHAGGGGSLGSATTVELVVLAIGAALVAAAVLTAPRGARAYGAVPLALLAALAALSALSISWAINPSDAWLVANRLFAYVAAFAGAAALARIAPRRWPSIVGGVLLACVAVSGYALLTKIWPEQLNEVELFARLREPFGYWNAVGLAGALALPACLWLGARRHGPPALNALAFPALGICLATTLMAYSRGSLLAAAIGLAFWFALVPLRLRGAIVLLVGGAGAAMIATWSFGKDALSTDRAPLDDRAAAGVELLVLVAAVALLLYVAGLAASFAADLKPMTAAGRRRAGIAMLCALALVPFAAAGVLAGTEAGLKGSIEEAWRSLTDTKAIGPGNDPSRLIRAGSVRSRYWSEGFRMWETEKLTGIGAGGYATARPRYRQDLLDVRHAHGFVPETMAELGLIGLAVSLALLVAWALATRRAIRPRALNDPERAGLLTLAATVVLFGAHSALDFTWTIPGVALPALICAGFLAGRGPGPAHAAWRLRRAGAGDGSPAAAQAGAASGSPKRRWPLPFGLAPARIAAVLAVAVFAATAAWSAWQPKRASDTADEAIAAMNAGDLDRARELAERAGDQNPLSIEPLLDLAAIEARAGRRAEAEAALEEAARLQPENWLVWMRLTDYRLFELDQPEEAMRSVRVAIFLNPRSWDVAQRYLDVRRRLRES